MIIDNPYISPIEIIIQAVDGTTNLVVNTTGIAYFTVPLKMNGMKLDSVHARVITAGASGSANLFNFKINGTDMLSTALMINAAGTSSVGSATPYIIDTNHNTLATNDLIAVTVVQLNTTVPKGLIVRLNFI